MAGDQKRKRDPKEDASTATSKKQVVAKPTRSRKPVSSNQNAIQPESNVKGRVPQSIRGLDANKNASSTTRNRTPDFTSKPSSQLQPQSDTNDSGILEGALAQFAQHSEDDDDGFPRDLTQPLTPVQHVQSGANEELSLNAKKQARHESPLTLLDLPQEILTKILGYLSSDVGCQSWEVKPGTAMQLPELHQMRRDEAFGFTFVNSQTYGETIMRYYDVLPVIISGRGFEFGPGVLAVGATDYYDAQGAFLNPQTVNDRFVAERTHAKLSLLEGKSKYGPNSTSLSIYAREVSVMIDGHQYEDDSIFFPYGGSQPFDNPEHQRLFDHPDHASEIAKRKSYDRKQGRVSINTILMANLTRFIHDRKLVLESVSIDMGFGLKPLSWQKTGFKNKKAYCPPDNQTEEAHLEETLIALLTVSGFKLQAGPGLVKQLQKVSKKRENLPWVWSAEANADITYPADAYIDLKDILEEIHSKAQSLGPYRCRDFDGLGYSVEECLDSFLPYPISMTKDTDHRMNKFYEFESWVYDDLESIKYLVEHCPCPTRINIFLERIRIEIMEREDRILEAKRTHKAHPTVESLKAFFLAFSPKDPRDPDREALLEPRHKNKKLLFQRNGIFDRALEMRKLINRSKKEPISAQDPKFMEMYEHLNQHKKRIRAECYLHWDKYSYLKNYYYPVLKTVKPMSALPVPEWDPKTQNEQFEKEDAKRDAMKLARTERLDKEIIAAVTHGDSQTAWLRLILLNNSPSFCPKLLARRAPSTVPIKPFKVFSDANILAYAKRTESDVNGDLEDSELLAVAKSRYAALREQHRKELADAGYGVINDEELV